MRCLYAKKDHLHDFAERQIARIAEILGSHAISSKDFGGVRGTILYRDGPYQVEFVDMDAGMSVPEHTHPGASGIEYAYSGEALMTIRGKPFAAEYSPERRAAFLRGKSIRLDGDVPHALEVGPYGFQFLSFQHWHAKLPAHIGENWCGAPSSRVHEELLKGLS